MPKPRPGNKAKTEKKKNPKTRRQREKATIMSKKKSSRKRAQNSYNNLHKGQVTPQTDNPKDLNIKGRNTSGLLPDKFRTARGRKKLIRGGGSSGRSKPANPMVQGKERDMRMREERQHLQVSPHSRSREEGPFSVKKLQV